MNKPTSLYLDFVRFIAALVVFFDHASGKRLTGGLFWRFAHAGAEAVTVFFVLSGFVISYSVSKKENTLRSYFIARASRIYSVVIPALIITAIADVIGTSISYHLYTPGVYNSSPWSFANATLFLNQLWWRNSSPGSDWSYWSLGYEVWYYCIFGLLSFYYGVRRSIFVALAIIIVGPGILSMFPIWLLGVALQKACEKRAIRPHVGAALFLTSILAWVSYELFAWKFSRIELPSNNILYFITKRSQLPQDYLIAMIFSIGLLGFSSMAVWLEPHVRGRWTAVRWLAGSTFSLYLFHPPLLLLLATVNPWAPGSLEGRGFVIGGTLIGVLMLAEVSERRKDMWRRIIESFLRFIEDALPRKIALLLNDN